MIDEGWATNLLGKSLDVVEGSWFVDEANEEGVPSGAYGIVEWRAGDKPMKEVVACGAVSFEDATNICEMHNIVRRHALNIGQPGDKDPSQTAMARSFVSQQLLIEFVQRWGAKERSRR